MKWLLAWLSPAAAFTGFIWAVRSGQAWHAALPMLILAFVFHPLVDALNFLGAGPSERPQDRFFCELALRLAPVLQLLVLYGGLELYTAHAESGSAWLWSTALATGFCGTIFGMTAAHELVHRRARWQRAWGIFLLSLVHNTPFRVEHVFGHHRTVGTREDPASARPGESLYAYWPRALYGTFVSAWQLDFRRATRDFAGQLILDGLIFWRWGFAGLGLFLLQALIAQLVLQATNYLEHYGLVRRETAPGRFEVQTVQHSWDSPHGMTNAMLFNLGLHAHHHAQATVPFEKLKLSPGAPRLPYGYPTMFTIALVPPIWRRVVDPLIPKASSAT